MTPQEHIIQKCVFELIINTEKEGVKTHDLIISIVENELVKILNELFSEMSLDDEFIEISSLDIDLGMLKEGSINLEIKEKLKVAARKSLIDKINENKSNEVRKVSRLIKEIELLVFYLKNGYLPWWSKEIKSIGKLYDILIGKENNTKNNTINNTINNTTDNKATISVLQRCLDDERVRTRLIYQFNDIQIVEIISRIFSYRYQASKAFFMEKLELIKQLEPIFSDKSRLIIWQSILKKSAREQFTQFLEDSINMAIANAIALKMEMLSIEHLIKLSNGKSIDFKNSNLSRSFSSDSISNKLKYNGNDYFKDLISLLNNNKIKNNLGRSFNIVERAIEEIRDIEVQIKSNQVNSGNQFVEKLSKLKKAVEEENFAEEPEFREQIFINNAGIVLFWPYLIPFFNALNLLEKDNFKDEKSRLKAMYVLQYLAIETADAEEYEMFLNKILCGLSPEEPIEKISSLSPEEIEEAEALSMAVINHWEILQNTSTGALRETFVQREGILTFKEERGWQLVVERKGVDMLMGSLPWGLSIITLPWMKNTLYVEW